MNQKQSGATGYRWSPPPKYIFLLLTILIITGSAACTPANTGNQAASPTTVVLASATPVVLPTTEPVISATNTAAPQPTRTPPPTFVTATPQPIQTAIPSAIPLACSDTIEAAILRIDDVCAGTNRNEACYGHNQVTVDWQPGAVGEFSQPSHRAALADLRRLNTSPYDLADSTDPANIRWGIALLRIQADLPDALPGQAITLLAYGDTTLEDTGGDHPMQTVALQTGFSSPTCADAPDPGILIQNDTGEVASLTINGVDILVGSTVLLQARPDQTMTLGILEGQVDAFALGEHVSAAAGMQIRVALNTDQQPMHGPSLEPLDLSQLSSPHILSLLDRLPTRITPPLALDIFPPLQPLQPRRTITPSATSSPIPPRVRPTAVPARPTATPLPPRSTATPVDEATSVDETTGNDMPLEQTDPTKPGEVTQPPLQIMTLPPLQVLPTATPLIMQQAPLVITLDTRLVLPTATPIPLY